MAWTAPPAFVVSEIVTAARMNILSDDLNYLKGNAGGVTISDTLTATARGATKFGQVTLDRTETGTGGTPAAGAHWRLFVDNVGGGGGNSTFGFYDAINARVAMGIDNNGNLGIGTTNPAGRLHGYDTISGFLHWKYDGVDGTARSVVPDGVGDVLYLLGGMGVTRASSGATAATSFLGASAIAPGGAQVLYSSGGDICSLQVAANGAITVQRTGGALTYKVGLWLLWL
jgi:hypothetical protein